MSLSTIDDTGGRMLVEAGDDVTGIGYSSCEIASDSLHFISTSLLVFSFSFSVSPV